MSNLNKNPVTVEGLSHVTIFLDCREGRRAADFPKLCVFLDDSAIPEHNYIDIISIKLKLSEYHSYPLVSIIWYNSREALHNIHESKIFLKIDSFIDQNRGNSEIK